jgi:hypothetical protein
VRSTQQIVEDEGLVLHRVLFPNGVKRYVVCPDPCVVGWAAALRFARHYTHLQDVRDAFCADVTGLLSRSDFRRGCIPHAFA